MLAQFFAILAPVPPLALVGLYGQETRSGDQRDLGSDGYSFTGAWQRV